ncbi:transposase [Thermoplasmatales archaeon SCGC AB-539-C06]|nr:transposase [Thermoplasmatales archaeon SCGC AB-539-C06]
MVRKRRRFSREFKINVIGEIENGSKQAEVCRKYNISPVMVSRWRKWYQKYSVTKQFSRNNKDIIDIRLIIFRIFYFLMGQYVPCYRSFASGNTN